MNIGIIVTQDAFVGGGYQYVISMVEYLKMIGDEENRYFIFYAGSDLSPSDFVEGGNWHSVRLSGERSLPDILMKSVKLLFPRYKTKYFRKRYEEIRRNDIDLLIDPCYSLIGYYSETPYIFTIHDLMHKYYKKFPEIKLHHRILRDIIFSKVAKRARLVLVDSLKGREDVVKFYGVPVDKISILPTIPSKEFFETSDDESSTILEKHNIPGKFIFYPAKFWHHKNHVGLLKAMKVLQLKYGYNISVVFVGPDGEALERVLEEAEGLNLRQKVYYLGYVSEEEKVALYRRAEALVMPSFFGPTNIPIWEAFITGCPVLTSDVYGIAEQVADAGLLFDPKDPDDIAEKIYSLLSSEQLRREIVKRGFERVKDITPLQYGRRILDIILKATSQDPI